MIPWWWTIIVFFIGAFVGILLMGLCCANNK